MTRKALLLAFSLAAFITIGATRTVVSVGCNVSPIVTAGHAIIVSCWTRRDAPSLHADLSPVTLDQAVALDSEQTKAFDVPLVPIATATLAPAATAAPGSPWVPYAAALSPPGRGAYAVRIYEGDTLVRVELSTVSTFGLFSMSAANQTLYAPIDLASFTVRHDALDLERVSDGARTSLHVAADGLYEDTRSAAAIGGHSLAYARAQDGSVALIHDYTYGSGQDELVRYYARTDRPVYRPGDTVFLRAILRTGTIGNYHIDRRPIVIDVSEYAGHPIARRTLTPDAYGSIATSVRLPDDAQLGMYWFMMGQQYVASFNVEAYKKPEYTLDVTPMQPYVVGGDTAQFRVHLAYLFGASAANLSLHYSAYTGYGDRGWYGPFSPRPGNRYESEDQTGDALTDANGDAVVAVPTKRDRLGGLMTFDVEARDASGRTVTQHADLSVVPGTFHIVLEPSSWVGQASVQSNVLVRTLTHTGEARPGAAVHVRVYESHWSRGTYARTDRGSLDVRTDAKGEARFGYTPPEAGEYVFEATATDERGDPISVEQYQWVFAEHASWVPPLDQPRLVPHESTFAPGETLRATLVLAHPAREAIVTLTTDRIVEHRVVSIDGTSVELAFAPPIDAQRAFLDACVPGEKGVQCAQTFLSIAPAPKHLNVVVSASKASYRPGEAARFTITATDLQGKPVRAQLSLGVVDEGIYAIEQRGDGDPGAAFYNIAYGVATNANWYAPNANPLAVKTIARVSSVSGGQLVRAGVGADVYNVNASAESASAIDLNGVPLRSKFADTAFWTPDILTDARGRATVSFTWPENLTTWRASAVAVTVATQLGAASTDTLVTKPLLVRLETPRFLRARDTASITGIVHGERPGTPVRMLFDAGALGNGATAVVRTLDASRQASATWPVSAGYVGSVNLTLRAGDGVASDGMQLPLPLLGAAPLEHERDAGSFGAGTTLYMPISLAPGELAGALHVSFAPSMIAQLAQTLREFDVYPYYCTEQTGSNGIVAAALMLAGAKQNVALPNDPKDVIAKARQRLMELRHNDWAWGWWAGDRSSIFMTAYALYAQVLMDHATGEKSDWFVTRGAQSLATMIQDAGASDQDVAFGAYVETLISPEALAPSVTQRLNARLDRADALTVAFAGLAAQHSQRLDDAQRAAQRLLVLSSANGGTRHWHEAEWSWRWWSDPIEETSVAALLLHETGHEAEAQQALSFIRAQRNGDWWYTTLDTAMASIAIAQVEYPDGAVAPNETVRVLVDGRSVATVRVTSLLPDASDTHVVIGPADMHDARGVTIERSGTGSLYWSTDFEKYAAASATQTRNASPGVLDRLFARAPALSVNRRYTLGHAGAWRVGDAVTVDLWITARDGAQYVTLEDPFPAGTEYQVPQGAGAASWSGEQFLDDRAAFFLYWLAPGETRHLSYQLRATTAGRFTAPGPSAFASYGPPIAAVGTGERVDIDP